MKKILYILMILSAGLFFTSCEKDENGRMPDDIMDSNVGTVKLRESSDMLIDVNQLDEFTLDLEIDVLFDKPFKKVELVVVFNSDFTKPYLLSSFTSLPANTSVSIQQIVDVVDELSSDSEIVEGDGFQFYTNIELPDGTFIPGYLPTGVSTSAPSIRNIMGVLKGASAFILIPVPCPFVPSVYEGEMEVIEVTLADSEEGTYSVDVVINTQLTNEDTVVFDIHDLWFDESIYQIGVNLKSYQLFHYKDPAVDPDEQEIVFFGNAFGAYGRIWFEDFTEPLLETCQEYLQFTVTPTLNDVGFWWGTSVKYTIGPSVVSGDKKKSTVDEVPLMLKPIDRRNGLQSR